jgi:hypothetical protein
METKRERSETDHDLEVFLGRKIGAGNSAVEIATAVVAELEAGRRRVRQVRPRGAGDDAPAHRAREGPTMTARHEAPLRPIDVAGRCRAPIVVEVASGEGSQLHVSTPFL